MFVLLYSGCTVNINEEDRPCSPDSTVLDTRVALKDSQVLFCPILSLAMKSSSREFVQLAILGTSHSRNL